MPATRRQFLGIGAGLVCGSLAAAEAAEDRIRCLDYGRSFICHKGESAASNAVRFQVESRITLFDDKNKQTHVFYQCASCKSETASCRPSRSAARCGLGWKKRGCCGRRAGRMNANIRRQ